MSLATRYLNFKSQNEILAKFNIDNLNNFNINAINMYNDCFLNYSLNPNKTNDYIKNQIKSYVEKNYSLINVIGADINYYIEKINLLVERKFKNIVDEVNLSPIISMCDYYEKKNISSNENKISNHYLRWRNEYYKMILNSILNGKYKIYKSNDKEYLIKLIEDNWNKINFENLIGLSNLLNKIKFLSLSDKLTELTDSTDNNTDVIGDFIKLISNKFDEIENIKKLLDYIQSKLKYVDFNEKNSNGSNSSNGSNGSNGSNSLNDLNDLSELSEINMQVDFDDNEKEEMESKLSNSKYNFRFILNSLKSNGYLLFEEFNNYIKNKYKKPQEILTIKTDKRICYYFIYVISQKDSNQTNRKVNELLISIKNYLEDIEESYYNNIAYRKITVKQESEKYKSTDLSEYNRENTTFNIFKYSNASPNDIRDFVLNPQIEPYFDIYKAYYSSRYPDREIEFDPVKSTLIVKMVFNSKPYYVHLALIQYIVLDKLFGEKNAGLNIKEISTQTKISIKNLQQTINSLLHIKLIKHSANTSNIAEMKFYINDDFTHSTNKISIGSLVIPTEQKVEKERELMHDRNTIVLSNIYDYVKKNRTFTLTQLYDEMSKNKIPFKIGLDQVVGAIKVMIEKEDITETNENNVQTYKYCE